MEDKKLWITVYLLRQQQVPEFERALLPERAATLSLADPFEGLFLPIPSPSGEPPWVSAVRSMLDPPELNMIESQSPGGLLVVRRAGRTFIVSFGHAWMRLEDEWLEKDFGRKVALNSIEKDSLLEIRAEQIFAKGHIANERSPRATGVTEFGVEFDRDLVSAIEGRSSVSEFGNTIRGATSLRINIPFPSNLTAALDKALVQFGSNAYTKDWPEIDNISPVKDQALMSSLDDALDAEFASGLAEKSISLFTPAYKRDDGALVDSYVWGRMSKTPVSRPYLMIDSWLNLLKSDKKVPSVASARDTAIHVVYEQPTPPRVYKVYDCFGYELTHGGKQYILSSAVWYEVEANFLKRTNDALKRIPTPPYALPAWNGSDGEPVYNETCAAVKGLLNCDGRNLHYGGNQSKFEFCDVVHLASKSLFFAKIVSKSQGMSHLVEQVRNTTRLFFNTDEAYRKELEKLMKKHHSKADRSWLATKPRNGEWNLCLISLGKGKEKLPFFAKISLVTLHRYLDERGHHMSFGKV